MTTTEDKIAYSKLDSTRHTRTVNTTNARSSLGDYAVVRLNLRKSDGNTITQAFSVVRSDVKITVDYNPVDGKCTLTEESLYEVSQNLSLSVPTADLYQVIIMDQNNQETGRLDFDNPIPVQTNRRFVGNFVTDVSYSFDQDSKELNVHDQVTSGAYVPLLISVVNTDTGNNFFIKRDETKPVKVEHKDMSTILSVDYWRVASAITATTYANGDINIKGKFTNECSVFTIKIDEGRALLFRISDQFKTRNFKEGTEIDFWLTTTFQVAP